MFKVKRTISILLSQIFLGGFVLISLAAVALGIVTQILLGNWHGLQPVHLLLFAGTMAAYNWHRLMKMWFENSLPAIKNYNISLVMLLLFLPVLIFALISINKTTLFILIPLSIATLLYSLPTRLKLWFFPVRKIPYIKVFMVAAAWSFVTVLLPVADSPTTVDTGTTFIIFTGRFFLLLAVTIPFDMRDVQSDSRLGILTLPVVFGREKARITAICCGLLFPLSGIALGLFSGNYFIVIPEVLTAMLILKLLMCTKCYENPLFYTLYLDGSLLIYGLIVMAGWYFF